MNLFKGIFLICTGLLLFSGSTSKASDRFYQAAFCSLQAADGIWAFSFDNVNVDLNCQIAENAVRVYTWSPIVKRNGGPYYVDRYNDVTAECYQGTFSFRGYGVEPLRRAYNELIGQPYCMFYVY